MTSRHDLKGRREYPLPLPVDVREGKLTPDLRSIVGALGPGKPSLTPKDSLLGRKAGLARDEIRVHDPEDLPEAVVGYIESLRLKCADGHTILRSSDGGATILLALRPPEQRKLAAKFVQLGIPMEVLEEVEVDTDVLEP